MTTRRGGNGIPLSSRKRRVHSVTPPPSSSSTRGRKVSKKRRKTSDGVRSVCVMKPGGYDVLKLRENGVDPTSGPNLSILNLEEDQLVVVDVRHSGVNYADICIRWGLYSSANKFASYPLVPGFEFSGVVSEIRSTKAHKFRVGDEVFGVTMFGGYSNKVIVPHYQLFRRPKTLASDKAAGLCAVGLTALYAIRDLANVQRGSTILVHSAAGGVGSMLCQIGKYLGAKVVGVVGSAHKVPYLESLGCDAVVAKAKRPEREWWKDVDRAAPQGFQAVFDANGVATLQQSYNRLAAAGRLVCYGFHSMLPTRGGVLSVWQWIKMAISWLRSPTFDPMKMTPQNRSVMAFNLSYMFDRRELLEESMSFLLRLHREGHLVVAKTTIYPLSQVVRAHRDIESGMTVGKLILDCAQ